MNISDCCGAELMSFETPLCSNCREHCEPQEDNSTAHYPHHSGNEYVYPLKKRVQLTETELIDMIAELHPQTIKDMKQ